MSGFFNQTATLYGNFPCNRIDDRAVDPSYSTAWWRLGPDFLWDRTAFMQNNVSGQGGGFWGMLSNWGDAWDPAPYAQSDSGVGQKRDGISGVTRDSNGSVLGGCTVKCFDNATGLLVDTVTSDSVTGIFFVSTPYTGQQVFMWAFKAGTPVEGASALLTPS